MLFNTTLLSGSQLKFNKIFTVAVLLFCFSDSCYSQQSDFNWVRNVHQQTVRDYTGGFSAYYENGLWGFVGPEGNVVIAPSYEEVSDFEGNYARARKNGLWGIIDRSGRQIFDFEFDSVSPFADGVALAVRDGQKSYLYSDGSRKVLPGSYDFCEFSDGLARIKDNKTGKWGYVDLKGVIRIDPKYDYATDFKAGHAVVTSKGKAYSVNKSGDKKQIELNIFQEMTLLSNGAGFIRNAAGTVSFLTKSFDIVPGEYQEINEFSDGLARAVNLNGQTVYLDEKGAVVLNLKNYAESGDFNEGKAWVRKNSKYGFVDKTGKLVVDTLFTYASDFGDKLAYVAKGQRQGVIKISEPNDKHPLFEISDIALNDRSGNNVVEADESFDISFVVRNIGDGELNDAVVTMGLDAQQMEWFSYGNTKINIGNLKPGEERRLSFSGAANMSVVSEGINLTLKCEADNLFAFPTFPYSFKASGINACKPVIETFWVYNEDHSPLTPGREAVLKMTVKNTGTDMAKDVSVTLNWPDGIEYRDKSVVIPVLAPNETKEVVTTFTVHDGNDNASKEFSLVAMVDEYTHKRNDVKYLSFATGKRNALTNLLSGVAASDVYAPQNMKKETKSELLVDLDQVKGFAKNRYALVIGNEDYNTMKQSSTYQPDVEFAVRDAETFAQFATNMMGVREDNVILVKNATYAQMKVSLDKLTKLARANQEDLELIVYYAGHGQVDGDSKDSYLIPVDVSITSPTSGIKLEDFYGTLSACNARKTFVFLDACYSGVGRGVIIKPKDTLVKGNVVVMTATSSTQRSMPYQEKNHGLFTYYLLKAIKEGGSSMSIGELYDQVSETVKTKSILINNAEQTPELLNGSGISSDWRNWMF